MLNLIKKSDYKRMPWKNGRGISEQMAIYPHQAQFPEDDFLWRLSSATLNSDDSFSIFPGYDRILMVWQGAGFKLNGENILPGQVCRFSGDTPMTCELIQGSVVDLGLIYQREKISAQIQILSNETGSNLPLPFANVHLLVCTLGKCKIQGLTIRTGDTLQVEGALDLTLALEPGQVCKLLQISLTHK